MSPHPDFPSLPALPWRYSFQNRGGQPVHVVIDRIDPEAIARAIADSVIRKSGKGEVRSNRLAGAIGATVTLP